jgi:hypothetical protein
MKLEAAIVNGAQQIGSQPSLQGSLAKPQLARYLRYCAIVRGHGVKPQSSQGLGNAQGGTNVASHRRSVPRRPG